jgi:hypothetical protein
MSEDLYGVTFGDPGTTYLVALCDGRGEAQSYMERMNEESEERGDDTTYEVVEIDPEAIDVSSVREQIERGFAVQLR